MLMCKEIRLCAREIKYLVLDNAECHTTYSGSVVVFIMLEKFVYDASFGDEHFSIYLLSMLYEDRCM